MLNDEAFQPVLKMARIELQPGPMTLDPTDAATWAYFPIDALVALGSVHPAQAAVALVGQHGCVLLPESGEMTIHAHVMSPGRAYRLNWTAVRNEPARYAQWLWHAAAAAHSLIGQMAQWSFCVQHHTPTQRLASWLLHCWSQWPKDKLKFHLDALPHAMRQCVEPALLHAAKLQQPSGFDVHDGVLSAAVPLHLSALACDCHQKITAKTAAFSALPQGGYLP